MSIIGRLPGWNAESKAKRYGARILYLWLFLGIITLPFMGSGPYSQTSDKSIDYSKSYISSPLKMESERELYHIGDKDGYTYPWGSELWREENGTFYYHGLIAGLCWSGRYGTWYYMVLRDDPVDPDEYYYVTTLLPSYTHQRFWATGKPLDNHISTVAKYPEVAGYPVDSIVSRCPESDQERRIKKERR